MFLVLHMWYDTLSFLKQSCPPCASTCTRNWHIQCIYTVFVKSSCRLITFLSQESNSSLEDQHKFHIVTQGPARAKDKKLYYVYSVGWNKKPDGKRMLPTTSKEEGRDYAWPQIRKPNEMYYNLVFSEGGNTFFSQFSRIHVFQLVRPKDLKMFLFDGIDNYCISSNISIAP